MLKKIRSNLSVKIFLITALVLIVACILTCVFIAWYIPKEYSNQLDYQINEKIDMLNNTLQEIKVEDALPVLEQFAQDTNSELTILHPSGKAVYIIGDTPSNITITETIVEDSPISEDASISTAYAISALAFTVEFPLYFADETEPYTMVFTTSAYSINKVVEAARQAVPLILLTILAISICTSCLYSHYITKPIIKLSRVSQKMSELDFSWVSESKRTDEIGALSQSLNSLSSNLELALKKLTSANDKLKQDIENERKEEQNRIAFFASASHELKTPITIIKGQLEGMLHNIGSYSNRDKYLQRSLEVTQTLESLVKEIIDISRMDAVGFQMNRTEFNLSQVINKVIMDHQKLADEKDIYFVTTIVPDLFVYGDSFLLERVISNLVGNALQHTPSGERVYINAHMDEQKAVFTILNTGTSIAKDDLDCIFNAFYRAEKSRSRANGGSGLGLYLVKTILDLHEAAYKIENTAAGVQFFFQLS